MLELIKNTSAYKVVAGDKKQNTLSHAYLVECLDEKMLRSYLKLFAKLIMCESEEVCESCRICRLIDKEAHPDIEFFPLEGEKLKSITADEIVEKSVVKPFELKKRLFVICGFENFEKSQNKLLKTLEEPPSGVILLLGTSNSSALLPTVKSRVKKIEIPPFSDKILFEALKNKYDDKVKLASAIALSDGKLGEVDDNYNRGDITDLKDKALFVLENLKTSRDEAKIAVSLKDVEITDFISVLKLQLGEMNRYLSKAQALIPISDRLKNLTSNFSCASICEIIAKIDELELWQHFNSNKVMLVDKLLFTILEAKHRWQKLSE